MKADGAVFSNFCRFPPKKYLSNEIFHHTILMHPSIEHTLNVGTSTAPSPSYAVSQWVLLCCCSLPCDIFNWRIITLARLVEHLKEEDAPPCLRLSSRISAPTVPAGPGGWKTHRILHSAYFAIKSGMFFLPPAKIHPRSSTEDCGISMYWRLAAGSYTFVILCSGLQREWKRAYYANWVLFG